jgi:hypothetical protein
MDIQRHPSEFHARLLERSAQTGQNVDVGFTLFLKLFHATLRTDVQMIILKRPIDQFILGLIIISRAV